MYMFMCSWYAQVYNMFISLFLYTVCIYVYFLFIDFYLYIYIYTHRESNIAAENQWLKDEILFGMTYFLGWGYNSIHANSRKWSVTEWVVSKILSNNAELSSCPIDFWTTCRGFPGFYIFLLTLWPLRSIKYMSQHQRSFWVDLQIGFDLTVQSCIYSISFSHGSIYSLHLGTRRWFQLPNQSQPSFFLKFATQN